MLKGKKIQFIARKYAGKDGWIDEAEESDEAVTSVIVNLGRTTTAKLKEIPITHQMNIHPFFDYALGLKIVTRYRTVGAGLFHPNSRKMLHNDGTINDDVTETLIEK